MSKRQPSRWTVWLMPPTTRSASRIVTFDASPAFLISKAAVRPAGPAPMTTTARPLVSPAICCSAISRGIPLVLGSRADRAGQAGKCTQTRRETPAVVDDNADVLATRPLRNRAFRAARTGRSGHGLLDAAHRGRHARRRPPAGHGAGARGRAR